MRRLIVSLLLVIGSIGYVHADNQRPSTVANVQASAVSSSAIRISWNKPWDNVGVDGYNIYRNGGYFSTVYNATNFIDSHLRAGTAYGYSVVAFDKARNYSTLSATSYATTKGGSNTVAAASAAPPDNSRPSAPTGLTATAQGSDSLLIQWNAPSGRVSGYNIYRNGSYLTTVRGSTRHTAKSLTSGREYRWQVVAFNGNKYSTKSSEVRATVASASTAASVQQDDAAGSVPSGHTLAFRDEFNASGLDGSKWNTRYRWGPWWTINNEQQFYVDSLNERNFGYSPFQLDGNHLTIQATRTPGNLKKNANNKNYLSGAMTTYGKFKMRYGYVEMRARLPKGKGLWPAFWMLHNQENGRRPEIDIAELIGDKPNTIYQTYHHYENGNLRSSPSYEARGPDYSQDFHVYGMKWEPGRITWSIDGKATNTYSSGNVPSEDMYLLLNLAVGGSWPGSPNGSTSFPAHYTIDYVRAYRRN